MKLMMLKKRNIDTKAREDILRVIQYNCRGLDADTINKLKASMRSQINHLHANLRTQFDAAIQQFNEDPTTQPWRTWFQSVVTLVKGIHKVSEPYIEDHDVDKYFLKNDLELVSDIWAPILDVLEPKFLMNPRHHGFAQVFLDATRKIFAQFLTISLKSNGNKLIDTNSKTSAIVSADLSNFWHPYGRSQWPSSEAINKPDPWRKYTAKARMFGKLKHSVYSTQIKATDVQIMIEDKRKERPSLTPGCPPASLNVPSQHVGQMTIEHVQYFKDLCKSDIEALDDILTGIERRKNQVLAAAREGEQWLIERERLVQRVMAEENLSILAWEHLIKQGEAKILATFDIEQDCRVAQKPLPPDHIPLKDVLISFSALVAALKKMPSPKLPVPPTTQPMPNVEKAPVESTVQPQLSTKENESRTMPPPPSRPINSGFGGDSQSSDATGIINSARSGFGGDSQSSDATGIINSARSGFGGDSQSSDATGIFNSSRPMEAPPSKPINSGFGSDSQSSDAIFNSGILAGSDGFGAASEVTLANTLIQSNSHGFGSSFSDADQPESQPSFSQWDQSQGMFYDHFSKNITNERISSI
jgi:hypothetical protein